jgi:hypothetical protein
MKLSFKKQQGALVVASKPRAPTTINPYLIVLLGYFASPIEAFLLIVPPIT